MTVRQFARSLPVQGFLCSVSISIVAMPAALVVVLMTSVAAKNNGIETASLLFTGPLIGQVIVPPVLALWLRRVPLRGQAAVIMLVRSLSAVLGVYLIITLTLPAPTPTLTATSTPVLQMSHYFCYGIWTLLGVTDQPLAIRSNLFNCRYYGFSILRSNAIGNLLGRGSMAAAPLALLLAPGPARNLLLALVILSYLLSLYAPWLTFSKTTPDESNQRPEAAARKSRRYGWRLSWETWFVLFQFLANASIGAIGFLLLSSTTYSSLPLPPYSVLYGVFLVVQAALVLNVLRLDDYASPQAVRTLFLLISMTIVIQGLFDHLAIITLSTIALGVLYALLLPLMAETVARKIEEQRLAQAMTLAKSVGRVASIISIWIAGWALANEVPTQAIQMMFGVVGVLSVVVVMGVERRLGGGR